MPTVSFDKDYLLRLIGKKMSDEELEYELAMIGAVPDEVSDEVVIDITPNRPDWLSPEGLARSMRYFLGLEDRVYVPKVNPGEYLANVDPETKDIRPYAVCAVVKGIEFDDNSIASLMQLQEKLHLTFSRNRKLASIGVYDLDKVEFPIRYRVVDGSYTFVPLGFDEEMSIEEIKEKHPKGREFTDLVPGPRYVVWEDKRGKTLSWPPIVNSQDTAVTEDTRNVLIDVTGTRLDLVAKALNIMVYSLAERGGKIYSVRVGEKEYPDLSPEDMELDPSYANKLLGLDLTPGELASLLRRMGHGAKALENKVLVKIPAYRVDVLHPIDLVEDIAIAYRYDRFSPEVPNLFTVSRESREASVSRLVGRVMIGLGFQEVYPYHLTNKDVLFKRMGLKEVPVVTVKSPVNGNYDTFRNSILPQILEILGKNKHHEYPQKLFAIGRIALVDGSRITEKLVLSGALADSKVDYSMGKSVIEALGRSLGLEFDFSELDDPRFIPGRSAIMNLERPVGILGEIHPEVLENFEVEVPVVGFELDLEFLNWRDW